MALDLSNWNIFKRFDARARVLFLIVVVIVIGAVLFWGAEYLSSGGAQTNASRVANAPQGLQSVPGGQLTPEYYQALVKANTQTAEKAQKTGGSAVPTLLNIGQPNAGSMGGGNSQCNIICPDEAANVKYSLDDWVRQGKIDPDVANQLQQLADSHVSVDEYSDMLNQLVKAGKLTPAQARELLSRYQKQHMDALLQNSAKAMDALIQSGQLPLEVANQLLEAQKRGISTGDYAAMLDRLVKEGKISPAVAQQLLAQYTKQHAEEVVSHSIGSLRTMLRRGQITADVAKALIDLEQRMVPLDMYADALQRFVRNNQLMPAVADSILNEFRVQKASMGPGGAAGTVATLLKAAEQAAFDEVRDLLQSGKITPAVAAELTQLINRSVSLDDFRAAVNRLVEQHKLPEQIAVLKIKDYTQVRKLRDLSSRLQALQANNASPAAYAEALKQAVKDGVITPEEAQKLLAEYQALHAGSSLVAGQVSPGEAGTEAFAQLREQAANLPSETTGQTVVASSTSGLLSDNAFSNEFATAQAQARAQAAAEEAQRLEALTSAMNDQAQQLIVAWQPTLMVHREGIFTKAESSLTKAGTSAATTATTAASSAATPLVRAGSVLFAVLDTSVNSDYPDSPVMATIVVGKYKGAKLLGKLVTAKGPAGQQDRIALTFSLMNIDRWNTAKSVNAFAIDPDTARSVMASKVNYHYLKRFGALMGAAFLKGYATGITNEGTSTTGIFGTSTTHPGLSPGAKIAVGLGEVGNSLGQTLNGYAQIPPTVIVHAGVGLGILFMADLTE